MVKLEEDTLTKLKCGECGEYLSCGPVFLKHDGSNICGRCPTPEKATRNTAYEDLAEKMEFPCRNRSHGCLLSIQFSELKEHEKLCYYRKRPCPIVGMNPCQWTGPSSKLLEHCNAEHPTSVISHPCSIKQDFLRDSVDTFITAAFNALFLIHLKVCMSAKKLFLCVRFVGDSNNASDYQYNATVENNGSKVAKPGIVVPYTNLEVEETNSVTICLTALQGIFQTLTGTVINVNLRAEGTNQVPSQKLFCYNCFIATESYVYRDYSGLLCVKCAPKQEQCEKCNYLEYSPKLKKHQIMFCDVCIICKESISGGTRKNHVLLKHSDIVHKIGTTWRITPSTEIQYCFISTVFGIVCCRFCLLTIIGRYGDCRLSRIRFSFLSYLPCKELHNFKCKVDLTNSATGKNDVQHICFKYTEEADWNSEFEVKKSEYNGYMDLKVDFIKN